MKKYPPVNKGSDADALDVANIIPTLDRNPVKITIEAKNVVNLMFLHERDVRRVNKTEPAVPTLPYHLKRFHQHVVVDRKESNPPFSPEKVRYEVVEILYVQ